MHDMIYRQAAIDALDVGAELLRRVLDETDIVGVEREKYKWGLGLIESYISDMKELPSAQPTIEPERTEYIPDTKAMPSERDCVDLSERVTATFYDEEYEEWSQKTVTVRDVLDSVCDEYTILPSAQPELKWIPCSEGLPEKPNVYTVTDSKGDVVRFAFTGTESSKEYWRRCAKAWMPLLEPYKGEQDE